jgi:hypothetical protein
VKPVITNRASFKPNPAPIKPKPAHSKTKGKPSEIKIKVKKLEKLPTIKNKDMGFDVNVKFRVKVFMVLKNVLQFLCIIAFLFIVYRKFPARYFVPT